MDDPFFRSYLNQQPSHSVRPVPVQQAQRRSSPKVVSVPVHFISSEQPQTTLSMFKDSAALKIQKVFRGFLVRKSVKKIVSIRSEISEIERRIDDVQVGDLIRRDAKERLRVNETLMSLLFKLDSIRGVDCAVRDLRKGVTKKAIAMQEKVDSIAQADHQTLDSANIDCGQTDLDNVCRSTSAQVAETSGFRDEVVDDSGNQEAVEDDGESGVVTEVVKEVIENCNPVMAADGCGAEEKVETGPSAALTEIVKQVHPSVEGSMEVQKDKEGDGRNGDKGNRELLEKLMDDDEKMMTLMMLIYERNEMQTRMLDLLSRRVERLEKAFMSDKLRRKKKRHVCLRRRGSFCI